VSDIPYTQEVLRKSVHLSSLWMSALILFVPPYWPAAVFAVLLAGNVFIEYGYFKKWPFVMQTYGRMFGKMLREKETDGKFRLSGSPYVLGGALAASVLFAPDVAACAMAVMLISDTAAALVGRPFGKHKINQGKKSVEGAAAFFAFGAGVVATFAAIRGLPDTFVCGGLAGVFAAMFAEVYENRIKADDNLSIPVIVGAFITAAMAWL